MRTSDESSLSSLQFESLSASHAHLFFPSSVVWNSCGVVHDARVNSFRLHSARGNSGDILVRTGVRIIHAVEFGEGTKPDQSAS